MSVVLKHKKVIRENNSHFKATSALETKSWLQNKTYTTRTHSAALIYMQVKYRPCKQYSSAEPKAPYNTCRYYKTQGHLNK